MKTPNKKHSKAGRPRMIEEEETLAVRLPRKDLEAIREMAQALSIKAGKKVTMSDVVRSFIRDGLQDNKETAEIYLNF